MSGRLLDPTRAVGVEKQAAYRVEQGIGGERLG
jgi:hypothetical protein